MKRTLSGLKIIYQAIVPNGLIFFIPSETIL